MTDDQVVAFVNGYMPAYELYLDQLRRGFFRFDQLYQGKAQLRVVLNKDRKVVKTILSR
jgi:D-glycerate 3-kinase